MTDNNNYHGIYLSNSNDNNILGNNATNNGQAGGYHGIYLDNSNNNTVSGNTANNNDGNGIYLRDSYYSNVSGNTANNNGNMGIYLRDCNNNTASENIANNNNIMGIYLLNSNNNTISGNIANNNNNYGIYFTSTCSNNLIYNNSFSGNNINAEDYGTNNRWDNGTIGNYWNDYIGKDANDDGIGDTPYSISGTAGSQDNYPIWWDAPALFINSPLPNDIFGRYDPPDFGIFIAEGIAETTWYTLDGGLTNITFMGLTGTISQTLWNALPKGNVTIRFYANDTKGYLGYKDVIVIKDFPEVTIISHVDLEILSGIETITVETSSFIGVEKVEFYINEILKEIDYSAPYGFNWDTTEVKDGYYTIKVIPIDNLGQQSVKILNVQVKNEIEEDELPEEDLFGSIINVIILGSIIGGLIAIGLIAHGLITRSKKSERLIELKRKEIGKRIKNKMK